MWHARADVTDVAAVAVGSDQELYLGLYRRMQLIRGFEDVVQSLFLKGLVHGTTHLCSGQEAVEIHGRKLDGTVP